MIDFTLINGTQVFTGDAKNSAYSRVYGAVLDAARERYVFPAYPPFAELVLADLAKVAPKESFTETARAQIDYVRSVPQRMADRVLPDNFTYITKPYEHQIEALTHLYYNPRAALFFDAGTGKSKVVIDLKRMLPSDRMLVFSPRVTTENWVREVSVHSGGSLKAVAIIGTPEQKREIIENYREWDVLVASYGTARNMGLPKLHKKTYERIIQLRDEDGRQLSDSGLMTLVRGVRRLADPERQLYWANVWGSGQTVAATVRGAETEAGMRAQYLEDIDYKIIIADESHCIKSSSSQQTKTVLALSRKAPRRVLMSGTPALGDPRHLQPQMKFLAPCIIPEDGLEFMNKYLVRSTWNKRIVTGFKNLNVLNSRVQRVAIRKSKEECLDLPERQIIDLHYSLSAEQQKIYNTLISAMAIELQEFFGGDTESMLEVQHAAVLLNKLGQVSSGFIYTNTNKAEVCNNCPHLQTCVASNTQPFTSACSVYPALPTKEYKIVKDNPKLDLLEEKLEDILEDPSRKVIIWGVYEPELDMIEELIEKHKWGHVRVDGKTSSKIQARIDRFNTEKDCRVYLGQIGTGVGITLNAATYMIFYALDWSLGNYLQAIDRNYRVGQGQKVIVYRFIGNGTIDEYKAKSLSEKRDISSTLTNKIACATCERRFACLAKGLELFDPGCVHKRTAKRTIAKAEVIS